MGGMRRIKLDKRFRPGTRDDINISEFDNGDILQFIYFTTRRQTVSAEDERSKQAAGEAAAFSFFFLTLHCLLGL